MNILFITRRFYPDVIGGGEISSLQIVKGLKARGHRVSVLAFTDKPSYEDEIEGIKVYREQLRKLKGFRRLSNLDFMYLQIKKISIRYVEKFQPDVVHLIHVECIPYTARALKKQFGIPLFSTVNGPLFGCFTQDGLDYQGKPCLGCKGPKRLLNCIAKWGIIKGPVYCLYSLWYMPLLRRSYKAITKFFAVSSGISLMLKAMGVRDNHISIIHNPVQVRKKVRTKLKSKLGLSDKKILLYAGRLHETKGVQYIIKALPYFKDLAFIIVGKGSYEAALRKLAKKLNVQDCTKFIGFVQPSELRKYYSIADLVALPCTVYESLSRMLLEACSFGIPVVASNIGGNSEIVEHDKNGVLLKTLNTDALVRAIRYILYNSRRYDAMAATAKKKIKYDFDPNHIAKQMETLYQKGLE